MQTLLNPSELIAPPVTETEILTYLRYSHQLAEIVGRTEQDQLVLKTCKHLGIDVSESELQAAGDAFRAEHQLLSVTATRNWFIQQQITVEDWSYGMRIQLLTQKLKEHLFSAAIDSHYLQNRENYRRVALSQILLSDPIQAEQVAQFLRQAPVSFCRLALQYSQAKQSRQNGGFVGIQFLTELMAPIAQAIDSIHEGAIVGPIQTQFGYHILKVEQWYPAELNQTTRAEILDTMFKNWQWDRKNNRISD